jgi:hypothetical protein
MLMVVTLQTIPATVAVAITISSLTHEREASPGETYSGTIEIFNNSDAPAAVEVYQTDYLFQSDGSNSFGAAGQLPRSNAAWLDFSPNRITIPPHAAYLVNYSVIVPANDTLTGTYWSMLMVEESNPGAATNNPAEKQAAISQIVRYGVQCVTHIAQTGEPDLHIVGAKLAADSGNVKELQIDVKNDGERWAVPVVWAELFDPTGKAAGKFDCEKKRIFPGTSVRFKIKLNERLKGNYKALIVLDTGGENVIGAKYDLEF